SQQGLMFVRDLPPARGMVFPFAPPRVVSFWMKNTYIELDLLFIAADGRVVKIIAHAPPLRLDRLGSDAPGAAGLGLRGGEAGAGGAEGGGGGRGEGRGEGAGAGCALPSRRRQAPRRMTGRRGAPRREWGSCRATCRRGTAPADPRAAARRSRRRRPGWESAA